MKNPIRIYLLMISMLVISIPFTMSAQDKEKEVKVRVKTVKVLDGKEVVKDTTFVLNDDDVLEEVMAGFDVKDDDSSEEVSVNVTVETDDNGGSAKKVIIIKTDDGKNVKVLKGQEGSYSYSFSTDEKGDFDSEKKVIIVSPESGNRSVMKWKSDDGEEYVVQLDDDFEKMIEMEVELDKLKNMEGMVFLENLENLEKLEDINIEVIRPPHPPHDAFFEYHDNSQVTDRELRDAGIKNKPDRLDIENINLNIDDGVVDLSFSLKTEGSPKVMVYNFFGDKVFSEKPELINGNYKLKMDLSAKQHGVYYLQIIQKNSSFTEKLKL